MSRRIPISRITMALHRAVSEEDLATARSLLEQGANVDEREGWGATPLHMTAFNETPDLARLLVEHGADVRARTKDGSTPLSMAACYGHAEIVRLLLENGAAETQADLQRALRTAALCEGDSVISVLQEFGVQIGLIEAIYMGDTEAAHRFFEEDVDLEQVDDGMTLLMHAVIGAQDEPYHSFVSLLLERGADVNTLSADGFTPLMIAVHWGKTEAVRELLEHGADPNIQGSHGQTALGLAISNGIMQSPEDNAEVLRLLRQAGAKDSRDVEEARRIGTSRGAKGSRERKRPKRFWP